MFPEKIGDFLDAVSLMDFVGFSDHGVDGLLGWILFGLVHKRFIIVGSRSLRILVSIMRSHHPTRVARYMFISHFKLINNQ